MTDDAGSAGANAPGEAEKNADSAVRVKQSAQTRIGAVRVGVMIAGPRDGVPTARLLVRSDAGQRAIVDVKIGGRVDLFGEGELELAGVEGGTTPTEKSAVTIRHIPAHPR